MDIEITLDIKHNYKSLITISRSERVPDGIFCDNNINTCLDITNEDSCATELYISTFILSSKVSQVTSLRGIELNQLLNNLATNIEKINALPDKLKAAGWHVSIHYENIRALISEEQKSIYVTNETKKPTFTDIFYSLSAPIILSFLFFGISTNWNFTDREYISMLVTATIGSVLGTSFVWVNYYRKRCLSIKDMNQ